MAERGRPPHLRSLIKKHRRQIGSDVARALSPTLALAAAFVLGLVGALSTRTLNDREEDKDSDLQLTIGLVVGLTALVTPWLFEISRLVFEVAMLPLALALFLLAVIRADYKRVRKKANGEC